VLTSTPSLFWRAGFCEQVLSSEFWQLILKFGVMWKAAFHAELESSCRRIKVENEPRGISLVKLIPCLASQN
jgi:hypothetical protein